MRTFLCLGCGEVYDESIATENNLLGYQTGSAMYACPKINCHCATVEVDDFLVSTIRNLNNLGFNTLACCSGHTQDSCVQFGNDVNSYILMSGEIWGEDIPHYIFEELETTLPEDFKLEFSPLDDEMRFSIRRTVRCEDEADAMMAIADNCGALLDWTNNELKGFIDHYFPDGGDGYPIWYDDDEVDFEGELDCEDSDMPCRCFKDFTDFDIDKCGGCRCDGKGSVCKPYCDEWEDCGGCSRVVKE